MRTKSFHTLRYEDGERCPVEDALAVEAVLQVKVNGIPYTTTVRTPGDDRQLIRGLLYTEGVLTQRNPSMGWREIADPETGFTACVELSVPTSQLDKDLEGRRSSMGSASCGLCGIREPEEIRFRGEPLKPVNGAGLEYERIAPMIGALEAAQPGFTRSGGCHAAAAYSLEGGLLCAFEDIGRHNAVDKAIGALLEEEALETAQCLAVSGRISYEIVYKAFQARIPFVLGISAASSLAVEMGARFGLTVIGFCRASRATVYSHPGRVLPKLAPAKHMP